MGKLTFMGAQLSLLDLAERRKLSPGGIWGILRLCPRDILKFDALGMHRRKVHFRKTRLPSEQS